MTVRAKRIKPVNTGEESEGKFRAIIECMEEGYYEVDLQGRYTFFNSAMSRLMGFPPEEITGQSLWKFLDEKSAARVFRVFHKVYLTGRPEKASVWEYLRKDGSRVLAEASIQLVKDPEGNAAGFGGVVREAVGRPQADMLSAAMTRAEAESRAKNEFLASMSHEIRTPLSGIIGMTELAMDMELNGSQRDIIQAINRESEALLGLVSEILDSSKIEPNRSELDEIPFDLRVLIEDLVQSYARRAQKKGVELISFISPVTPVRLAGDPGRLRQVMAVLLGNALKFTGKGEILIRVERVVDLGDEVLLRLSVRDTGMGIPTGKREKIFESLGQAKRSMGGKHARRNLGLSLASRIVEMMRGRISMESMEWQGSTFSFTAVLKKQENKTALQQTKGVSLRGMRVLVAGDSETSRFILAEYLKSWGCLTGEASGGMEAVTLLRDGIAGHNPFDLVIMDFHLPRMDGFKLSRMIRRFRPLREVPLILLTAAGGAGDGKACRDIGIQGYLLKPTRKDDLKKAIILVMGLNSPGRDEAPKLVTRHSIAENFRREIQILLVEDCRAGRQVAVRHLGKAGYQVDTADDGQQAVSAFKRKQYDLVLMDTQMPVMDGYSATRAIRQWEERLEGDAVIAGEDRLPRVPIIGMTTYAIPGYREMCLKEGMDDFLPKPLIRDDLLACLDRWIRQRRPESQGNAGIGRREVEKKGEADMEKQGPPIDLERAMSEFGADRDFIREVLQGFLSNVRDQIEGIRNALAEGKADTVRREAHSIKGGAANICADALSQAAFELETMGKSGCLEGAEGKLGSLEQEFLRLEEFDRAGV